MTTKLQGNLPLSGFKSSDEPVRDFFDTYYKAKLEFPANQVDAVVNFFEKRGFDQAASSSVAAIIMQQAKIDGVPVFKLLDTLKGLNEVQLSSLITEILNYHRSKTSTVGFRLQQEQANLFEARNIETFEGSIFTEEQIQAAYVQPGYVEIGYIEEF